MITPEQLRIARDQTGPYGCHGCDGLTCAACVLRYALERTLNALKGSQCEFDPCMVLDSEQCSRCIVLEQYREVE